MFEKRIIEMFDGDAREAVKLVLFSKDLFNAVHNTINTVKTKLLEKERSLREEARSKMLERRYIEANELAREIKRIKNIREGLFAPQVDDKNRIAVAVFIGCLMQHAEKGDINGIAKIMEIDRVDDTTLMRLRKLGENIPAVSFSENIKEIVENTPGQVLLYEDLKKELERRNIFANRNDILKEILALGYTLLVDNDKEYITGKREVREQDRMAILKLAMVEEELTIGRVMAIFGWNESRTEATFVELVKQGLAVKDSSYVRGDRFYFPLLKK